MPVGGEEKARHFILQLDPVFQGAVIVADVQRTGRTHAGENAGGEHQFVTSWNLLGDKGLAADKTEGHHEANRDMTDEAKLSTQFSPACTSGARMPLSALLAINAIKITKPKGSTIANGYANFLGSNPTAIRPPYNGGMGKRFNS